MMAAKVCLCTWGTTRLCMVLRECNTSHLGVAFTRRSWRYMGSSPQVHLCMVVIILWSTLLHVGSQWRVCKHSEVLWYLETPRVSLHTSLELVLVMQLCLLTNQHRLNYNNPGMRWSDLVLWHKQLLGQKLPNLFTSLHVQHCCFALWGYMMFKVYLFIGPHLKVSYACTASYLVTIDVDTLYIVFHQLPRWSKSNVLSLLAIHT